MTVKRLLPVWGVGMVAILGLACNNLEPSTEGLGGSAGTSHGAGGISNPSGGSSGTGGALGKGGSDGAGGTQQTGGSSGSGGTVSSGGSSASGGSLASGGSSSSGGRMASGGSMSSGGSMASGGSVSSGGRPGSGGTTAVASGGSGGSSTQRDAGADSGGAVTYTQQISALLKTNCLSCHSGSRASGGVDLSTYTSAKSNASRANSAIQSGAMPPGAPLSTANKQLFQSWVTAGEPN